MRISTPAPEVDWTGSQAAGLIGEAAIQGSAGGSLELSASPSDCGWRRYVRRAPAPLSSLGRSLDRKVALPIAPAVTPLVKAFPPAHGCNYS
jgi:hypothetical protein